LTGGYHLAWVVSASIAGAGLIAGSTILKGVRTGEQVTAEPAIPEAAYSEAA
jgi:hypothetical protein